MKMNVLPLLSIAPAMMLLSGCIGHPPPHQSEPDQFVTNIKDDGTKLFSFSVDAIPARPDEGKGRGRGEGPPPGAMAKGNEQASRSSAPMPANPMDMLYDKLALTLENNGYCREGYIEIDNYETNNRLHVLGECNETATEQDKTQFANRYGY